MDARPHRPGPGRHRQGSRAVLHGIRHPRPQADRAGARDARGAAAAVHRQHQDRSYSFVNDAFLRLVGLDRDDVLGKTAEDVLGPDVVEFQRPYIERAAKGESVTYERESVDADGRQRWLRNRIVPDFRFDGTIKGYYIVGHDITDLKQAQDALAARESQLRAIMDGVPAPVAYIDRDERCQYVNRTFLHYFGLTAEQVTELRLRDVVGHGIYQSK
ncbi:MAG: PAS domain S-box protein [Betaproteobacteria bacterium]|nr:MAG: PAS domain S-box protein [Betaproteobacteria bacterium]